MVSEEYTLCDHLGSTDIVTNANGDVLSRIAFDAYGNRLQDNFTSADSTLTGSSNYRGFTGHDMLDNLGLIHMGGRVYDPDAGRFLSADIIVQAPGNSQSYNRYSYVLNNPLSLIDPTGYRGVSTENTANKSPPEEVVNDNGSAVKAFADRWADNYARSLVMAAVANHQRSVTAPLPGGGMVTFNISRSTYNAVRIILILTWRKRCERL